MQHYILLPPHLFTIARICTIWEIYFSFSSDVISMFMLSDLNAILFFFLYCIFEYWLEMDLG